MDKAKRTGKIIFIAPIMTVVCLMFVYAIKGIYPFGTRNIAYYDMAQSMVPLYYHTYDVLHGTKALLFDWYTGGGSGMLDTLGNFVLSPFNLFFLFIKRENILNAMSVFLVIKLAVAAFSMSCYSVKKYGNIDAFWHVIAGMLYASCGFVIQYYTNIHFLDIVALFPLLLWAYEELIYASKTVWYTVLLALLCIINLYLCEMICIYLILYGAILLKQITDKEKKKKAAYRIGFHTFVALLISAVVNIPTMISLTDSVRNVVAQSFDYQSSITKAKDLYKEQKYFMLYGCEIVFAGVVAGGIGKDRNYIKRIGGKVILLALMLIPIWVEGVNVLWHAGGYVQFPMRFGYMLTFTGLILLEEIIQIHAEYANEFGKENWLQKAAGILSVAMLPMTVMVLYTFSESFTESGIRNLMPYHAYWLCFLLLFLVYVFIFISRRKGHIKVVVAIMVFSQIMVSWYGFLAPTDMHMPECSDQIVIGSEEIKGESGLQADYMNRIKDNSVSLSANYPVILQRAAMSNWTWGTEEAFVREMWRQGYSQNYTRVLDAGGTLFSDMLLNIKDIISEETVNNELYTTYAETQNYLLSKLNYGYPFGMFVKNVPLESERTGVDYQNELFTELFDSDNELFVAYEGKSVLKQTGYDEAKGMFFYDYELPVDNKVILYFETEEVFFNYFNISINGELQKIPTLENRDNVDYPAPFNNGIVECGTYENEVVQIHLECFREIDITKVFWSGLQLDVLKQSIAEAEKHESIYNIKKSELSIQKNTDESGYVYLPIGYSRNWKVSVNGEQVQPLAGMNGAFFFIPVQEGENEIVLNYCPQGLLPGLLITFIGLTLFAFKGKVNKVLEKNIIVTGGMYVGFYLLAFSILMLVYCVPIIAFVMTRLGSK